jgi:hypothetical protein
MTHGRFHKKYLVRVDVHCEAHISDMQETSFHCPDQPCDAVRAE